MNAAERAGIDGPVIARAIRLAFRIAALGAFGLFAPLAEATTSTATMAVSANITASCTASATGIAFGTYVYVPAGPDLRANGSITVTCTSTTPYNVGLNAGISSGAGATTTGVRFMTGTAGVFLQYIPRRDAGTATVWGSTIGTDTVAGTGTGIAQPLVVYGDLYGAQNKPPGSYTDTLTATITY